MTNPKPRPALRRAPDAHVHPALSIGTTTTIDLREDRSNGGSGLSKAPQSPEPKRGALDDRPRHPGDGNKRGTGRKKREQGKAKKDKKVKSKDKKKKRGKTDRVDMRRRVPSSTLKRLRGAAKARGTLADGMVTSVLEGWSAS